MRLVVIEKAQTLVMADLKKYLKTREDAALLCLSVYLSSEEVKTRFTSWTLDEVPKAESSWEVTENLNNESTINKAARNHTAMGRR